MAIVDTLWFNFVIIHTACISFLADFHQVFQDESLLFIYSFTEQTAYSWCANEKEQLHNYILAT